MSESLLLWRTRARWFAAEFLVIVTGVLVALALNAFYQRSEDSRHEATYLTLLSRDMRQTIAQLEEKIKFEAAQVRDGVAAYQAISAGVAMNDRAVVSANLAKLVDRRTMVLRDATYQDLLSTGNLRLIRNRQLRDQVVDYYETTRGEYDIMNRNNAYLVDQLYVEMVIGQGLVKPGTERSNATALANLHEKLWPMIESGYVKESDYLWSRPLDGPEWARLKVGLLARIRVAGISEEFARQVLARTQRLSAAIEAERGD